MPSKVDLLRARTRAFKSTLEKATPDQKDGYATVAIAENFNKILLDTEEAYPDLKDSLPAKVTSSGPFARVGASDAKYIDMEMFAEQLLAMLDLVDGE